MKKLISWLVPHLSLIYKIVAMLLTTAIILVIFPNNNIGTSYDYAVGGFWKGEDLYAPYDFAILKSEAELESEKSVARQESLLYYTLDSTAHTRALRHLELSSLDWQSKLMARKVLDKVYSKGYLEVPSDIDYLANHTLVVLHGNVGSEHSATDYFTSADIEEIIGRSSWGGSTAEVERRARLLVDSILVPSLHFDAARSKLELDSRLSQTNYASRMVQQGELIVAKGDYIDKEKGQAITSLQNEAESRMEKQYNPVLHAIGQALLCIIAFVALFMFMKIIRHSILNDNRKVTFVLTTVVLAALMVAMVERIDPEWVLLAPICIVPIMMRVFFDMRVALYIDLTVVIILGNLVPNSFEFIFYQLVTGMMSLVTVRNFEHRSNFFLVALTIFLTYSLIYTAGILSQDTSFQNLSSQRYLMFFLNALLTLLAYPLIYLFEKIFSMTTALTLMEISSTNTPALRELSRKAPGTFQHSMQVSNISEDLINEIGGNALLAKVGALYHDIGKTMAPMYFTENQKSSFNPHDELDYEDSARVITQHTRDGIMLAKKYRLPADVTDFIRTHHGTTVTGYFYAMWTKEHPGEEPDMSAFQYAGPKPFSRETAVVMLVDSVEAATKSLKDPTRESIEKMVNSIIDSKISQKQLNYCNITYGEVTIIRQFLVEKILSVYHVRVAYPVATPNVPTSAPSANASTGSNT